MDSYSILEKMRNSPKDLGIDEWLLEFLSFAKSPDYSLQTIIDSVNDWKDIMFDQKAYDKFKRGGSKLYECSAITYIYMYHSKECETPQELTNMRQIALDASLMTEFFNMNIYNIEETSLPFLGFIEGIAKACEINNIDPIEFMIRFFYIFFSNYDYVDQKNYGPIITRFYELHMNMSGSKITKNPDGSLNIDKAFLDKLSSSERKCITDNIRKHEKPTSEEYKNVMTCLKDHEVRKDPYKILWTYTDGNYILVKSKKNVVYLANRNTGDVLESFENGTPISKMISDSMIILS